jgi:hypothetical protein
MYAKNAFGKKEKERKIRRDVAESLEARMGYAGLLVKESERISDLEKFLLTRGYSSEEAKTTAKVCFVDALRLSENWVWSGFTEGERSEIKAAMSDDEEASGLVDKRGFMGELTMSISGEILEPHYSHGFPRDNVDMLLGALRGKHSNGH